MALFILCLYIAIIPIVLSLCKAAGIDEQFREVDEYEFIEK